MPDPQRIAYVSHVARLSGAEIGLLRFVEASAGVIDATVILAEDGPLVAELESAGATVEVLELAERSRSLTRAQVVRSAAQGRAPLDVANYVARLAGRLRKLRPDLVHTYSLKAGVYGTLAARAARRPVVWHLHDRIASDYLPAPVVPLLRTMIATAPSAVIANSDATLATVGRRRRGLRAAVVPYPIPQPAATQELREFVGRVGIVGRLTSWKGQDVFLRAFAQAFADGEQEAVVIGAAMFGEDAFAAQLQDLTRQLGLKSRVTFTGFRRDVAAELERLDVLVHASVIAEPLGNVVLEGMATGLPVIAADAGGPAEYIEDGVNGLMHRPGDVASLAAAMRRLAEDRDLRERLAVAGRRSAERFSGPAVVEQTLRLYRDVLESPR